MKDSRTLDWALLVLRLALGAIILYHGSQKLFGAFGGLGFAAQLESFEQRRGIPPALGSLAVFAEFFGGLGILVGLLTRLAAFGVACTMVVATFFNATTIASLVASPANPRPINDTAYPLALFAIALALVLVGAGRYSLDQRVFAKRKP